MSEKPIIYNSSVEGDKPSVFIGGRKSKLAVVQSTVVAETLAKAHDEYNFPVYAISTLGDQVLSKPLYSFGGKALWTKELETLLLEHVEGHDQLDMVVHSLKDMPTTLPEGCYLGAISKREDPRDALIMSSNLPYTTLDELPDGSVVGTSSIRRQAQLRKRYPKLVFESIRGNVQTRLNKLNDPSTPFCCTVLAAAGLERLGMGSKITSYLDYPDVYYAVGQGALGIEIRSGDERIMKLLEAVNDNSTSMRCTAERALMRKLEGGCSVPIGVVSEFNDDTKELTVKGIVVSVDGQESVTDEVCNVKAENLEQADAVGCELADKLISKGAKKILDEIHLANENKDD